MRQRRYPARERSIPPAGKSGKRRRWRDDPGGTGWEPARVDKVCERCLPEAEARFERSIAALQFTPLSPVEEVLSEIEPAAE